ncbi:hypothetical protein A3A41_00530 [Candidatus Kaiserbacteria bacterium RIFCSPLOWO2_01_FULL_54_22]|nr:MAG: hypothetical protein A3A41_00530 [Candidatus Kaiserbacteria bacterium RIFCSPLOWO2_01_FULL_54_22]
MNLLYRSAHERVSRFPKVSRHSLGARIETTVLDLLESLYLAQSKGGASRFLLLNKADIQLKILLAHLRLAHATRCLNDAGFAELSTISVEIGRMLGGWIKQTKARE